MCSSSPVPATAPTCPIPTQARSTASTKRFVLTTFTHGAALIDDEIHALFAARKAGFRLVLVADSSHSVMVTRAVASDPDADDGPRPRFMPIGNWLPAEQLPKAASRKPLSALAVTAASSAFSSAASRLAGVLLLWGCKEGPNNFSYDSRIRVRPNGAFTYYALKTRKALKPNASYVDWLAAINPVCLAVEQTGAKRCGDRSGRAMPQGSGAVIREKPERAGCRHAARRAAHRTNT